MGCFSSKKFLKAQAKKFQTITILTIKASKSESFRFGNALKMKMYENLTSDTAMEKRMIFIAVKMTKKSMDEAKI